MIAGLEKFAGDLALTFAVFLLVFGAASIVERRHAIEPGQPRSEIILDYKLAAANAIFAQIFAPLSGVIIAMGVSMAGGGFIALRADGGWFLLSLAIVILTVELQAYWFHRLQHCVPFLWSMHSLHHSAEAMTTATGARHYWAEQAIISAFLPGAAMVFRIPPQILLVMPLFFITEYLAHMNAKVRLGPLTLVLNNPQFHRIHHSIEPQHHDKNFCKNLPVFDLIFGTAWIPGRDEFPPTGLTTREKPKGLFEGVVWPFRHVPVVRRLLG
jgi:sterol desaturase/sphingolipid hydroxylase (fatty acid hydroxylase superfamily)